jgi:hypothetical protein
MRDENMIIGEFERERERERERENTSVSISADSTSMFISAIILMISTSNPGLSAVSI